MEPISMTMTTNIDAMFKRKRGRPPKNRVIEVMFLLRKRFIGPLKESEIVLDIDHKESSNWAKFLCGINVGWLG